MTRSKKFFITLGVILAALVGLVFAVIAFFVDSAKVTLAVDQKIDATPISVERMRQIGEWEFLSISDEEIVDTVKKHIFSNDELVRIYYGELRLGIDMREMADDAIVIRGDSIDIQLPQIKLLDENFIDETRTRSFYESGKWSGEDHEALYRKAKRLMKKRCLTRDNKDAARENAIMQVRKMLFALGVENARVK